MFIFCLIPTSLNSSTRELLFTGVIGIVNRYLISIVKTSFRGITFFLFQVFNTVSQAQGFKLTSQLPKRNLNKVLIVEFPNINFLLNPWIIANYQFTNLCLYTMVDYQSSSFVEIVSYRIITLLIESCLFIGKRFYTLKIFFRLKITILLVIPRINAFKSFPINQKLMPVSVNTSTKIIYTQIDSNSLSRIN